MKNILSKLSNGCRRTVDDVADLAAEQGLSLYLVGGIVRDLLMERENVDLDFVVEEDAIAFARCFANKSGRKIITHERFGTATVYDQSNSGIDFATARQEVYAEPGALPEVQAGTIEDDLWRRDFSINAMAIKINGRNVGLLVDPCGGRSDLETGIIRVLHERSFVDDPTRILRAIRFEQRFGFRFDEKTIFMLEKAVLTKMPRRVTLPRYFAQFKLIFDEPDPVFVMVRIKELGAFEEFLKGADIDVFYKADVRQYLSAVSNQKEDKWKFYCAGLLRQYALPARGQLMDNCQIARKDQQRINEYIQAVFDIEG